MTATDRQLLVNPCLSPNHSYIPLPRTAQRLALAHHRLLRLPRRGLLLRRPLPYLHEGRSRDGVDRLRRKVHRRDEITLDDSGLVSASTWSCFLYSPLQAARGRPRSGAGRDGTAQWCCLRRWRLHRGANETWKPRCRTIRSIPLRYDGATHSDGGVLVGAAVRR